MAGSVEGSAIAHRAGRYGGAMVRIDDRGPAIVVHGELRRQLAELFESAHDVVAAYLFGSQASGNRGPLSDIDLAVWLDDHPDPRERLSRQLALSSQASSLLGTTKWNSWCSMGRRRSSPSE